MSRIDDLISEFVPHGVPYLPIGDSRVSVSVVAGATPRTDRTDYWKDGTIPWMSSGEVNKGTIYATDKLITKEAYDSTSTKLVPPRAVVVALAGQGKTRGTVARTRIELCTNQSLASIITTDECDSDFLFYFLTTQYAQLRDVSSGDGARGGLNLQMIRGFKVPLPPLAIQLEIVRILDQFAQLELELGAEMGARRAQYAHYAGALLAMDADIPRVRLGDVATIVRGASPRPIQQFFTEDPDGAPWIKIGDVPPDGKYVTGTAQRVTSDGAAKSRRIKPGDFILSNSMSFGRPYISKIEGYIHDGWLAISGFEGSFAPDYLYHLLRSVPVQEQFERRAGAGTVQNLNAEIVRSVEVPLPPREAQQRIIALLDRFDALVNDLRDGLPAEINARRRQYDYYRDRLLTFKERAV